MIIIIQDGPKPSMRWQKMYFIQSHHCNEVNACTTHWKINRLQHIKIFWHQIANFVIKCLSRSLHQEFSSFIKKVGSTGALMEKGLQYLWAISTFDCLWDHNHYLWSPPPLALSGWTHFDNLQTKFVVIRVASLIECKFTSLVPTDFQGCDMLISQR